MATRIEMQKLIREQMNTINERARDIRQEVIETDIESEFLENQIDLFRALTGTKTKKRIATGNLSRFNKKKLQDILNRQELFLNSKYSTIEGREEIRQAQFKTLSSRVEELSEENFNNIRKFFSKDNDLYNELKEAGEISSDQIVDIINEEYTYNDIVEALNKISTQLPKNFLNNLKRGHARALINDIINNPDKEVKKIYGKHSKFSKT